MFAPGVSFGCVSGSTFMDGGAPAACGAGTGSTTSGSGAGSSSSGG